MRISQEVKAELFSRLHTDEGLFIIPNPWDAGSAKILAGLGFKALATTSAGLAFSLGKADGIAAVTRNEALQNARVIADATTLPVSADLENGYGHKPSDCAETILLAAEAGLVGGSIEDTTGDPSDPILTFELSVERIKAAVQAANSLPFKFTLTARAENLIYGRPDLADTIKRLQAFAEAGADVLFAPGLKTIEEVKAVVDAVAPKPVNVVMGLSNAAFTAADAERIGVKRISTGSSLARVAYGALLNAATGLQQQNFAFAEGITSYATLNKMFA